MNEILEAALAWQRAGFAVLPLHTDTDALAEPRRWKTPVGKWGKTDALTAVEVERIWDVERPYGLGLRMGALTGTRETAEMAEVEGRAKDRLSRVGTWLSEQRDGVELWRRLWTEGYVERSPSGGVHFIYRVEADIPAGATKTGNTKLARDVDGLVLAETRGLGGFVAVAPSPGYCHPSGEPWTYLGGSEPGRVLTLSHYERELLLRGLMQLDETPTPSPSPTGKRTASRKREPGDPLRPGDDYNARADWHAELQAAGWTYGGRETHAEGGPDVELWTRPGKEVGDGHSATLGYARTEDDEQRPMLYVFSSSWDAPEQFHEMALTPFAWFAATYHPDPMSPTGADFVAAASELATLGYGDPMDRVAETASAQYEPGEWPTRAWTDLGNAVRMFDRYEGRLLWVPEVGWAVYDEGRWRLGAPEVAQQMAQQMVLSLPSTEGASYDDEAPAPEADRKAGRPSDEARLSQSDRFEKWCHRQQAMSAVKNALEATKGLASMRANIGEFDSAARAMLLNVRNGVVNLRDGSLLPHSPSYLFTTRIEVDYDANAQAPEWTAFLARMQPDVEQRAYLQRIMGYTISGSIEEQAFFIHFGAQGANGKSTLHDTFSTIMGALYTKLPKEYVMESRNGNKPHPTGIAQLKGARYVIVSETGKGERISQDSVKEYTGDSQLRGRFMGKDFFSFEMTAKLHYVTNHLPTLTDDPATWRRVHVVDWPVSLAEAEWDRTLRQRIEAKELPGVLAWAVAGCVAWQALGGLARPSEATELLRTYRAESDVFQDFVDDALELSDEDDDKLTVSDVYEVYKTWCSMFGVHPLGVRAMSQAMRERGFEPYRTKTGRGFARAQLSARWVLPKGYR